MAINTNGSNSKSNPNQVVDGVSSPSYKWFSLQDNKLDATYHPIDSTGALQIGWWGTTLSDVNGAFSAGCTLTTDAIDPIHTIVVSGDSLLNEYPVDFTVRVLDAGTEVYKKVVTGNTLVNWKVNLTTTVKGQIELTVTKVNKANRTVKILESNRALEIIRSDTGTVSSTDVTISAGISINSVESSTVSVTESDSITVSDSSTDSGTVSTTESDSLTVNLSRTESGTASTTETDTLNVSDASTESTTASVIESKTINVSASSVDSGTVSVTDVSSLTVNDSSVDSGTVSSSDSSFMSQLEKWTSDSGTVSATESKSITVNTSTVDSGTVSDTETSSLIVNDSSTDSSTASSTETSILNVTASTSDSTSVSASESKAITVSDYSTDSGTASSSEISSVTANIGSVDSSTISDTESSSLTVNVASVEASTVSVTESSSLNVTVISSDSTTASVTETKSITVNDSSTDSGTVSTTESKSVNASLSSIDSSAVSSSDVSSLTVNDSSSDSGTISTTETDSITVQDASSDTGTVSSTDSTISITVNLSSMDATTISLSEVSNLTVTLLSAEATSISEVPDKLVTASIVTSDAAAPGNSVSGSEVSSLTVSISRPDTGSVSTVEASFMSTLEKWRSDTGTVSETETKSITVTVSRADSTTVSVVETSKITNSLSSSDSVTISKDTEYGLELSRASNDSVIISVKEEVLMTNVYTKVDETTRRIYGKVEITYTDPFLDPTIVTSSTGDAYNTSSEQTADGQGSKFKWFSLDNNVLDGNSHPVPATPDYQYSVGWWSDRRSDSTGTFATPVTLSVSFDAHALYQLSVNGDDKLNDYPVNFDVTLYDPNGNVITTVNVVGNNTPSWLQVPATPYLNVASMKLTIYKVNRPYATAKITEFFSSVKETYEDEALISIDLLEEQIYQQPTIPIGNITSNEITVRLDNTSRKFDSMNPDSALQNLLKKNRKIKPYFGIEVVEGEIEWHPLGVFWSYNWNAPTWDVYAEVIGRDTLELMRLTTYKKSVIKTNVSLYQLALDVLTDSGLTPDQYIIDTNLQNKIVPYGWLPKTSHRDALAAIAAAALGRCYCNRDGQVVVEAFDPPTNSVYTFTNEYSIIDSNHPVAFGQVANEVTVEYYPRVLDVDSTVYNSYGSIVVPANSTITQLLEVTDGPIKDVNNLVINGGPVTSSYTAYAWGVELTLTNSTSSDVTISSIQYNGKKLLQSSKRTVVVRDDKSIRDNGLQTFSITSDLIQTDTLSMASANKLLATYKDPRHDAVLDTRGNIALRLGDRVTVPGYKNKSFADYFVTSQRYYWEGYLESNVIAQKIGG